MGTDSMELFIKMASALGESSRQIRKTILANRKDKLDAEAYCPLCKKDDLIPVAENYGLLKCIHCEIIFDIPYYLDKKMFWRYKDADRDFWIATNGDCKGKIFRL